MRRKCSSCDLVGFESDLVCKRCGAETVVELESRPEITPRVEPQRATRTDVILSYGLGFFGALVIEFLALMPIFATMGTHMRADSPQGGEYRRLLAALHFPTIGLTWGLSGTFFFPDDITFFTPLTQIVFWTFVLAWAFRYWLTRRTSKLP